MDFFFCAHDQEVDKLQDGEEGDPLTFDGGEEEDAGLDVDMHEALLKAEEQEEQERAAAASSAAPEDAPAAEAEPAPPEAEAEGSKEEEEEPAAAAAEETEELDHATSSALDQHLASEETEAEAPAEEPAAETETPAEEPAAEEPATEVEEKTAESAPPPEPEAEAAASEEPEATEITEAPEAQEEPEAAAEGAPEEESPDQEERPSKRRVSVVTPEEEEALRQQQAADAAAEGGEPEPEEDAEGEQYEEREEEDQFASMSESDVEASASDLDLFSESDPEVEIEPIPVADEHEQFAEWASGVEPVELELSVFPPQKLSSADLKTYCELLGATNRGKSASMALLRAALEHSPFLSKFMPEKAKTHLPFADACTLFECAKSGRRVEYPTFSPAVVLPTFIGCTDTASRANLPFRPILFVQLTAARTAAWTTFTLVSGHGTSRKTVTRTHADFLLLDEALKKTHRADGVLPDLPDQIKMDATSNPSQVVSTLLSELQVYIDGVVAYCTSASVTWWELFGWLGWSRLDMVHCHIEDMKLLTEEMFRWGLQPDPAEPEPTTFAVSEFWLGSVRQLLTTDVNTPDYGRIPWPMDNSFIAEQEPIESDTSEEHKAADATPRWKAGDIAMIVGLKNDDHLNGRLVSVTNTEREDRVNIHIPSLIRGQHEEVDHKVIMRSNLAAPVFAADKFGEQHLGVVDCVKGPLFRTYKKASAAPRVNYHNVSPAMFQLLGHVYGYPIHRIQHTETKNLLSAW